MPINASISFRQRPKWLLWTSIIIIGLAFTIIVLWQQKGNELVQQIYQGEFHPALDALVQQHKRLDPVRHTLPFYMHLAESILLRFAWMISVLILLLWILWPHFEKRLVAFRQEQFSPEQLAVFRIIAFGTLLYYPDYPTIFKMSALPEGLLVAPPGWSGLLNAVPPNLILAKVTAGIYLIASFLALIGYKTRIMGILAVASGIYFLGIPQFYGKINHYHHLLWFAAIAAAAPVEDRWSITSWRNKNQFVRHPSAYANPFHYLIAMLAIIYFFAAWWKLGGSGINWIWGNGAWLHIQEQAQRMGTNIPSLIAENELIQKILGLGTLIFELSWGYFAINQRIRWHWLVLSLIFHLSIFWLMHINFWTLPIFYLVFLPWEKLKVFSSNKPALAVNSTSRLLQPIGLGLIWVNSLFGLMHIDSWPFAVYPSFGNPPSTKYRVIYLVYSSESQHDTVRLDYHPKLLQWLPRTRLGGLHNQLIRASDQKLNDKVQQLLPLYLRILEVDSNATVSLHSVLVDLETAEPLSDLIIAERDEYGRIKLK